MSRLPRLTQNRKGEQKTLENGMVRKAHICVGRKKEHRPRGGGQISKSPQHMETGSEKEEVLTGCPCGFCCLIVGLKIEVCVRVEVIWMSVQYMRSMVLQVSVCLVDKGCWAMAQCSRGGRHPAVCQSTGWKMTAIWIESLQHNSQGGHVVIDSRNARV